MVDAGYPHHTRHDLLWTYGYRQGVAWLVISLLAFLVGAPIAQLSAFIAHRVCGRRNLPP